MSCLWALMDAICLVRATTAVWHLLPAREVIELARTKLSCAYQSASQLHTVC